MHRPVTNAKCPNCFVSMQVVVEERKMHLIVTVNHGPSCLLRFMAEGEASDSNPGYAIYRTDRHSKVNNMFIIWLSIRQTKAGRWYRIDSTAFKKI